MFTFVSVNTNCFIHNEACAHGHSGIAIAFIDLGLIEIDQTQSQGKTALHFAAGSLFFFVHFSLILGEAMRCEKICDFACVSVCAASRDKI